MKTEWLEWLVLFKRYNSIEKVSEECHVTSRNIRKMLTHLEEEMELLLFDKSGRNWKLTAAGIDLAETSEKIINSLNQVKDKHKVEQSILSGNIEIVSANHLIYQNVLKPFRNRYPDVNVSYVDMTYEEALEHVKRFPEAMAVIPIWQNESFYTMLKKYEPYCNIQMLYRDEHVVFLSKQSDLAKAKDVYLKDIANQKIVSYIKNGDIKDIKQKFKLMLPIDDVDRLNVVGTNSMDYFSDMIKNDFAIGIGINSNFITEKEDDEICRKKFNSAEVSNCIWSLVYNINKKMSACDKQFISALDKYCAYLRTTI